MNPISRKRCVRVVAFAVLTALHAAGCSHGDHDAATSHEHEEEGARSAAETHVEHEGHEEHEGHTGDGERPHDDEHREGRVRLSPEATLAAGIEVSTAGPRTVTRTLDLPGEIVPNADRLAHIVPRFPGIAKQVKKGLGDRVDRDEVLAIVESNESLAPYEVRSLIAGTVIEKHITLGEFVRDDSDVFVVADLRTMWANITVYARDLSKVARGQRVEVRAVSDGPQAVGVIDYVAPALGETMRAGTARVTLANPELHWRPGMFVTASIAMDSVRAPVAVFRGAIQRIGAGHVVFVEEDGEFEARPVDVGALDEQWGEIVAGLSEGTRYVTRGAFVLKSELLKSEATHDH
jgi:cobalt-zinc-cadmium efflux system membrane fusion protein